MSREESQDAGVNRFSTGEAHSAQGRPRVGAREAQAEAIRSTSILIIDDRDDLARFCARVLGGQYGFLHATSAVEAAVGKLRYANGGTLFLNEIAELSYEVQAKLLTALERREVVPVGDVRSFPADFRLITATSRDLPGYLADGRFRDDLLHRIAHHAIRVPPLRERRADIPALVRVFLRDVGQGAQEGLAGIAREAVEYLSDLPWNGNVRQLKSVIEAASASAAYIITLADVREVIRRFESLYSTPGERRSAGGSIGAEPEPDLRRSEEIVFGRLSYRDVTARYYRYLFRLTGGKLPEVARAAGIAKATAYEWKERFQDREE